MKRRYIQPQVKVEFAQCEMLLAASKFSEFVDTQSIAPQNEDYNEEFAVKGYTFGDDFDD